MKELVIEIDFNLWKHVLASNEVYSQIRDHFIEFVEGVRHRERRGTEGKRGWNFFSYVIGHGEYYRTTNLAAELSCVEEVEGVYLERLF